MKIPSLIVITAALLISGCSKSGSAGIASSSASAYPKEAAAVVSDSNYKLAFTSDQTGISYYLRRLAPDEAGKMPDDFVIKGENASLVFVPIKDGKIVDAPLEDRAALGYKIPEEMLK